MKHSLFILLTCIAIQAAGQTIDTVIHTPIYTSYFCNKYHEPLFVVYKLYKGGGNVPRTGMTFKTGGLQSSATAGDYAGNGFDEGHLCPAQDEAFDRVKEEQTFRFYNCLPQTPRLNRGIWKTLETQVRKESQTDSLLIVCGGIFGMKRIGVIYVPDFCYKAVYSLKTGKLLHCVLFPNDNSDTSTPVSVDELRKKLNYSNPLLLEVLK